MKPDEELVPDAALDVEEDWEKITHKKVAANDAPMNKASTASGFDYNKHPTSGMGAVVDGVDLDRGCDVSAWFEFDLHPLIMRAIQDCGFATPTPIQRECLLPATKGRCDIIGAAQTGSGKTLAFALPFCIAYFPKVSVYPKDTRRKRKKIQSNCQTCFEHSSSRPRAN